MKLRTLIVVAAAVLLLDFFVLHAVRNVKYSDAAQVNVGTPGAFYFPRVQDTTNNVSFTTLTLNSVTGTITYGFAAPKAGSICSVGFRTGAETVTSALDIWLETVSTTTGVGNGTSSLLWANAMADFSPQAANTFAEFPLAASGTVTQGQVLAFTIIPSSTAASINMGISVVSTPYNNSFPYNATQIGTPTVSKGVGAPIASLQYCDGTYGTQLGYYPITAANVTGGVGPASSPNEAGNVFMMNAPQTALGIWWMATFGTATSGIQLTLYDGSSNILASTTVWGGTQSGLTARQGFYYLPSSVLLSAGQNYRVTATPVVGTATFNAFSVGSAAQMQALDGGANVYQTQATSSHVWVDTLTERFMIGLILQGSDDGAGGASSSSSTGSNVFLFGEPGF